MLRRKNFILKLKKQLNYLKKMVLILHLKEEVLPETLRKNIDLDIELLKKILQKEKNLTKHILVKLLKQMHIKEVLVVRKVL